jgi:hypothetical protein
LKVVEVEDGDEEDLEYHAGTINNTTNF